MNVAFDPWIPVVNSSGKRELASLCSVLTEGENYVDLAVRPHERVALMRLLLCVAHAALDGPKDYDEWCDVPKRLPQAARTYLETWRDAFELFHPTKPWLQVAALTKSPNGTVKVDDTSDWTSASKLNFSFATGNASTLFDHEGMSDEARNIPLHETIVSLITFQCFSVGGLIGQVYWNGTRCGELADPKKTNGPVKSSDGPCVPSSMIHAFLRGKNLGESILLNLPTHEQIRTNYLSQMLGVPVWEKMPRTFADVDAIANATSSYTGRLVPLTRLIRLSNDGLHMLLGDGFPYDSYINGFPPEPSATVITKDDARALLSYRPSRALWRELSAIAVKRKAGEPGGPMALSAILEGKDVDLVVSALARDKATIIDTVESIFHIPAKLTTSIGAATYESEVKIAESLASRVGWALETYRLEIDGGWEGRLKGAGAKKGELKAKLHSVATTHYWTTVEKNLSMLMSHIEAIGGEQTECTRVDWRKMLFKSACEAYTLACGQDTPRQRRAFAKGWQKLTATKDEPETDNTDNKEGDQ